MHRCTGAYVLKILIASTKLNNLTDYGVRIGEHCKGLSFLNDFLRKLN